MSLRGQQIELDQNHNIGKSSIVVTNNNKQVSKGSSNNNVSNNNNMVPNQKLTVATPNHTTTPSMGPNHTLAPSMATNNNGFGRDIMSFDGISPLPMSMSTEDMANMPIPLGVQEFLMPMETFFFSGFQCFESITGGSTVAIDNKIEQAMDLVKRHLMYAVREEVEILKQQIGEMMDRIGQLEYENTVLRSEAKPETLSKLLQPRLAQPPQAALPTQPQTASITAAPTQQQPAASQVQPPQQQQTSVSQVGQPPSTT